MKKALLVLGLAIFGLTACTPEQLQSIESRYGIDISDNDEATLIALPDKDVAMWDGAIIRTDGNVVASPTLSDAIGLAEFGVCDSWRPVYDWFAANTNRPPSWSWFRKVLKRESGCGLDVYNERTGDSGPIQINPVHRKWIKAEHGYDFSQVQDWEIGIEVAAALYNKTGPCNWSPPKFCARR